MGIQTYSSWHASTHSQEEHIMDPTTVFCPKRHCPARGQTGLGHIGIKTRVWLGGAGSEQRDMPLIRRLIERVRRCAARRPLLICTDGLVSSLRAIRETFRDPVHTGKGGRPRLRPWRNILMAQVVKRS